MNHIEVLAPMAGISDGAFCRGLLNHGFDMVTLGGYNADPQTINAGREILSRGRPEFDIAEEELTGHIEEQIMLIKDQDFWDGLISVNLRSVTPEPIIEISRLKNVDVVEINAHCRQTEITYLGCGQQLLKKPSDLEKITEEVVKKAKSRVSVKIRANVPDVDDIKIAKTIEKTNADYLHIDAMKPGYDAADYDLIKSIRDATKLFIIGNNSIKDIKSARKMLSSGADGISIARAAISGTISFDLSQI